MVRRPLLLAVLAALSAAPVVASAQASDPAAATVDQFDKALLDTMKQARTLGVQGRFRRLQPAVEQAYDLPLMVRLAVGPKWTGLSATDQTALTAAFSKFSVATYAHNFDSYDGQSFTLDPMVQTRGQDKLVKTELVGSGKSTPLNYRMRQSGGGAWKIIDVYYNGGVSQLTAQRSDFSATLDTGGAPALTKKLNERADDLLK